MGIWKVVLTLLVISSKAEKEEMMNYKRMFRMTIALNVEKKEKSKF